MNPRNLNRIAKLRWIKDSLREELERLRGVFVREGRYYFTLLELGYTGGAEVPTTNSKRFQRLRKYYKSQALICVGKAEIIKRILKKRRRD